MFKNLVFSLLIWLAVCIDFGGLLSLVTYNWPFLKNKKKLILIHTLYICWTCFTILILRVASVYKRFYQDAGMLLAYDKSNTSITPLICTHEYFVFWFSSVLLWLFFFMPLPPPTPPIDAPSSFCWNQTVVVKEH